MKRKRRSTTEDALMLALACGATVEAAAAKAGLSKRTVYRYLENDAFRKQLQIFRSDMVYRSAGMLTAASMEAVKTLLGLLSTSTSEAVRHAASRSIIELGLKLRQCSDVEERMSKIEERFQMQDQMKLMR